MEPNLDGIYLCIHHQLLRMFDVKKSFSPVRRNAGFRRRKRAIPSNSLLAIPDSTHKDLLRQIRSICDMNRGPNKVGIPLDKNVLTI